MTFEHSHQDSLKEEKIDLNKTSGNPEISGNLLSLCFTGLQLYLKNFPATFVKFFRKVFLYKTYG